ncbi:hypothetical protein VTK73DRAFT_442 [Phialemonium thermophilum]|uniref:Major facilitator superfamily (MFS) profile domain-containing protein n=1 Tax=Phialemonium thermophilum TaxID=223376 RepID=A0ABR3XEJ5_9PEZI
MDENTENKETRAPSLPSNDAPAQLEDNEHENTAKERSLQTPQLSASEDQDHEQKYVSGLQLVIIMTSLSLAGFLMLLDTSIVATAIPRITDHFHSLDDIGWYAGAYQLSSATLQPLTGKMYNQFSTKWTFMSFFAIFELGSLLCAVAISSSMFIVGRAIAGMGLAGLVNGCLTIIAGIAPLHKRAVLTGTLMGIVQLGIVCGPLVGGALTEYTSWRWCFYINLPIGAVAAFALLFTDVRDQVKKPPASAVLRNIYHELDLLGFALFAPAAIQLLLALQYGGNEYAWNSSVVIGLFCGSAATFVVWAVWNRRQGDNALIPVSMARRRVVWTCCLTQMLLMTVAFISAYFLPLYFQGVRGKSPVISGVYTLPSILSQLFAAVLSGVLVERVGYVIPFALFGSSIATISSGLFSLFSPNTPAGKWAGFQILNGFGRGIAMQMPMLALQANVQPHELSSANSLLAFSQYIGGAIFLVVGNTVFSETLKHELATHVPGVNGAAVAAAGATAFRHIVPPAILPAVLKAYARGIDNTFFIAVATGSLSTVTALGLGWVDLRKKKEPEKKVTEKKEDA